MKFIDNINKITKESNTLSEFICENGNVCDNEINAAAKKIVFGSVVKHYIKSSKRQRRLFNPIIDKLDQKAVIRTELEFEFQEVNRECFDQYTQYLKNRNSYFLLQANNYWKR